MIEKIDKNQISGILKESSSRQPGLPKNSESDQADASLQISYDSLIEKTKQLPKEDIDAVQKARQLLLSGQLDSPENIRAAAEAIIKFGI
jgi:hypothetical protein